MEAMIAKGAQQQRNGVLASLGLVADSLRMLPDQGTSKEQNLERDRMGGRAEGLDLHHVECHGTRGIEAAA